jgi:hypothetical protein
MDRSAPLLNQSASVPKIAGIKNNKQKQQVVFNAGVLPGIV